MNKVLLCFTTACLSASLMSCTTSSGNSVNSSNATANQNLTVNSNAVTQNSNALPANTQAAPEEVKNYTDANEALEAGKRFFDDNEFEKSIAALEQAVKLDPNLAEAHFLLGINYEAREKESIPGTTETTPGKNSKNKKVELRPSEKAFNEAIKLYEKQTKKNPKDAAAFFNLGRAYSQVFDDDKASKALKQAVKLQPEDSEYYYELGVVLNKLAQYDEALAALKKSMELDPDNGRTEREFERAEAGKKRVDAAKKEKPQQPPPGKERPIVKGKSTTKETTVTPEAPAATAPAPTPKM